ncbi:MAG TPA: VWA domain-containing protein [Pyrinomonadaceae bacterium]|nr:VWA domain-containing protein [Pyrinomonadaceae bacterium]
MIRLLIPALIVFASILGTPPLVCGQGKQPPALKGEGKSSPNSRPSPPPTTINEQELGEGDAIRVEANLVTVPASIMDRDGRYITNLRKEDFQISEDGVEQEIALFEPAEQPFTVLFLIDVSSSMSSHKENLERAVNGFLSQLRPDDQLIATSFFQMVDVMIPATRVSELRAGIKPKIKQEADCPTYLYDAVDNGLKRMKKVNGRKAIVLFSDGEGTGFTATAKGTLHHAEEQGALIYAVQFGTFHPAEPPRNVNRNYYFERIEERDGYVRDLTRKTGGRYYRVEDLSNFATTFRPVADELRRQYSLGYYPKKPLETGQRHEIKVRVRLPNLVVRARDSYTVDKAVAKRK